MPGATVGGVGNRCDIYVSLIYQRSKREMDWFRQQPCFALLKTCHARTRYWCTVWVTDAELLAMFEFP
jgi:hypothetical protein